MILAYVEETTATNVAPARFRAFGSTDDGLTWTALPTVTDSTSTWNGRVFARDGYIYVGQSGPLPESAFEVTPYHVLMRSGDLGQSWASAVEATVLPLSESYVPSQWFVSEFLRTTNGTILALGIFSDDETFTFFGLLRSTNGGATFEPHRVSPWDNTNARCGIALDDGVVLVVRETSLNQMYRSTDNGDTWALVTLGSASPAGSTPAVRTIIKLTNGRVCAIGDRNISGARQPVVWYSDDQGANWTVVSTPVSGLSALISYRVEAAAALTENYAVLCMSGGSDVDTTKPFRMTSDGITWDTAGTYSEAMTATVTSNTYQATLTDAGNVLIAVTSQGSSLTDTEMTIWRGVRSGSAIAYTNVFSANFEPDLAACGKSWIANVGSEQATPPEEEEGEETLAATALTGRNDMLVLSSATGKWGHYAY